MPVRNRFAELLPELTKWRRDLHTHPELGFDLPRTSAFVADKLRAFGCDEVVTGIATSGVVGIIRGRDNGRGRTIGLRADMDALPIVEATGAPHASTTPGHMHACGHDGHTTMVLGAARYLAETRNFDGTVAVIFQPAEEGGGGGEVMVNEGIMDRFGIDEVYGMHNVPGQPLGSFAIRPGPFYAATDEFNITVTGKAGHAAQPHQTTDAALAASHVVVALQSVVARSVNPVDMAVLSVTSMRSATDTHNVIVGRMDLRGTIRTLSAEVREQVIARLRTVAESTAAAFGATAQVTLIPGYPVMENHVTETGHAARAAEAVSGDCAEAPYYLWGEDFGYMLNARPGAYILMGTGPGAPLHHPEYDFNDEAIPLGASWFVEIAEQRLGAG